VSRPGFEKAPPEYKSQAPLLVFASSAVVVLLTILLTTRLTITMDNFLNFRAHSNDDNKNKAIMFLCPSLDTDSTPTVMMAVIAAVVS
jgi:hypothetical protein